MENLTNSADEVLIDSLSFKLPASGNYVIDRRSVTFHTEGSNSYSPQQGTKVIRFRLAGEGRCDPSTVRAMFDVVNDDSDGTKRLRPIERPRVLLKVENCCKGVKSSRISITSIGYRSSSTSCSLAIPGLTIPLKVSATRIASMY